MHWCFLEIELKDIKNNNNSKIMLAILLYCWFSIFCSNNYSMVLDVWYTKKGAAYPKIIGQKIASGPLQSNWIHLSPSDPKTVHGPDVVFTNFSNAVLHHLFSLHLHANLLVCSVSPIFYMQVSVLVW